MAKAPAIWTGVDSSGKVTSSSGGALLLETGGYLLFEGSTAKLLLENSVITTKEQTAWANGMAKAATKWSGDGTTSFTQTNSGVQRKQQNGTVRQTQAGVIRVLQPSSPVTKADTAWSSL